MGFIFTGHGFKRRRKNHRGAAKRAVPAGSPPAAFCHQSVSLPCANMESSHWENRGQLPIVPCSFEHLPPEILLRIYCYAGVGSHNSLSLTCKYFHGLFNIENNTWFLDLLVQTNFLVDLNKNTKHKSWQAKFTRKFATLPVILHGSPALDSIYFSPLKACQVSMAIDSRLFELRQVDARLVLFVHERYGLPVASPKDITSQLRLREKYLEWRYMVFQKFVSLVKNSENNIDIVEDADQLRAAAEASEQCIAFSKQNFLSGFRPLVESSNIPDALLQDMTPQKLDKIAELKQVYRMNIAYPARLVSSVFSTNSTVPEKSLDFLDTLEQSDEDEVTFDDVVGILKAYSAWQKRIRQSNTSEPATHSSQRCLDYLFSFAKWTLSHYYTGDPSGANEVIWDLLKEIEVPELLDHVMKLGFMDTVNIF